MKDETRNTWIEFLALGAAFTLFIAMVHPWVLLATAFLSITAAVMALFNDRSQE